MATNGVAVGVEVGFAAASFAFKVQTRASATVLAKTCCTGTVAAAAPAAVVVTESCRRFVAESGSRVSTVDCGSLHDNAPRRICMRAATT